MKAGIWFLLNLSLNIFKFVKLKFNLYIKIFQSFCYQVNSSTMKAYIRFLKIKRTEIRHKRSILFCVEKERALQNILIIQVIEPCN